MWGVVWEGVGYREGIEVIAEWNVVAKVKRVVVLLCDFPPHPTKAREAGAMS